MPKVSRDSAAHAEMHGPVEVHHEYVQFSPSEELRAVSEAMNANMQAMMQGA